MRGICTGYFNSRPHGGRQETETQAAAEEVISTHALTEGDEHLWSSNSNQHISTHALTEGDVPDCHCWVMYHISTHALTEGDMQDHSLKNFPEHFNSRPHGGRRLQLS